MMFTKLNALYRRKDIIGYVRDGSRYLKEEHHTHLFENVNTKKHRIVNNNPTIFSQKPVSDDTRLSSRFTIVSCSTRGFCTQDVPKHPNVFGDLAYEKYEKVEMDEAEEAEERFVENEVTIPRRLKPSAGQYASMIKDHINRGDLLSALSVLDLIKNNRDKPTVHMYNLLIRGAAVQGDIKKAFKLYNDMKKRALTPNAATYTSLLNACATTNYTASALQHLSDLRQKLYEINFPLNATHYNAMIKAYSWHNKLSEAFQIADEMRDKKLPTDETTFNSLMHAAIADKETGLRHTLMVWHLMHNHRIKPSLRTYNLLLRAIRDTNCGDLRVNDVLVSGMEDTKIYINESERPDLLASPPALSNLPIPYSDPSTTSDGTLEHKAIASLKINDILLNNRLILFGGLEGILKRMDADDVKPDVKTITLLMELAPNFASAENAITKCAKARNIELDVDYYNMVMKKRSLRFRYDSAKEILYEMQRDGLRPNIMTFGVLALGCFKPKDGKELIEGMETTGFAPNAVIMGTLIANACHRKYFTYLSDLLDYMYRHRIKPNKKLRDDLATFEKNMKTIITRQGKYDKQKLMDLKERFGKFQEKYAKWLNKMEERESKYKDKVAKSFSK